MRGNILMSTGKFSKGGYMSVNDKEKVYIYANTTTDIKINVKAILTGYFSETGMWHILIKDKVEIRQPKLWL